jgi:hypothetical protein
METITRTDVFRPNIRAETPTTWQQTVLDITRSVCVEETQLIAAWHDMGVHSDSIQTKH